MGMLRRLWHVIVLDWYGGDAGKRSDDGNDGGGDVDSGQLSWINVVEEIELLEPPLALQPVTNSKVN